MTGLILPRTPGRRAAALTAVVAGLAVFALTGVAQADKFPDRGGPAHQSDPVSGYPCVSNSCDVLRLPGANCICMKQNPTEQDLSKLRLKCSTRQGGQWVACPVKPRYGISVE